jgi:hypothetical protein
LGICRKAESGSTAALSEGAKSPPPESSNQAKFKLFTLGEENRSKGAAERTVRQFFYAGAGSIQLLKYLYYRFLLQRDMLHTLMAISSRWLGLAFLGIRSLRSGPRHCNPLCWWSRPQVSFALHQQTVYEQVAAEYGQLAVRLPLSQQSFIAGISLAKSIDTAFSSLQLAASKPLHISGRMVLCCLWLCSLPKAPFLALLLVLLDEYSPSCVSTFLQPVRLFVGSRSVR